RRLSLAGKKPIDKHLRCIGIRRSSDKTHGPAAGAQLDALFPIDTVQLVYRSPLGFCSRRVPAADTKRKSSLRQPVSDLPSIPTQDRLHVSEEPLDQFRT